MELEPEYKKDRGSGNGTETAFTVEARYNYINPIQIGDQIFDNRWREVSFRESLVGVPNNRRTLMPTIAHGMLGYAAAQALRWWLHAVAEATHGSYNLETRIVSFKITYSHKIEAVDVLEASVIKGE